MSRDLISPEYLEQQRQLHAQGRYGRWGKDWVGAAMDLMRAHGCATVLDYGCGQGTFKAEMNGCGAAVAEYDPAIKGKDKPPKPADLVMCTDVLEHIEEDKIDAVIRHIRELTRKVAFFVIHTRPASKNLPDGRNAHILLRDSLWWFEAITTRGFYVLEADHTKKHLIYTCK